MIKGVLKVGTLATFLMALSTAPSPTPAFAAGGGGGGGGGEPPSAYPASSYPPSPPSAYPKRSGTKATHKLKKTKQSSLDDSTFGQGYRAAYATIYDRNDYAAAIEQLKALGHDDPPNVANLIGYSYRKLGDYKLSQVWYERAESRPEPCADLAVLRPVADRARQPRSGALEPHRGDLRHRLRGVSVTGGCARKATAPVSLLSLAATPSAGAALHRAAPPPATVYGSTF